MAKELEDKIVELGSDSVAAFFAETGTWQTKFLYAEQVLCQLIARETCKFLPAVVGASLACCPAPEGYFREIRKICDRYGVLLVLDEIMSGEQ